MFSILSSEQNDFANQEKQFREHMRSTLNSGIEFMHPTTIEKIDNINESIDKQIAYLKNKVRVINLISAKGQGFKTIDKNELPTTHFFVAVGLVNIEAPDKDTMRKYLKLEGLENAKFEKKHAMEGYLQYLNEYITKLEKLKQTMLSKEYSTTENEFQYNLQTHMKVFLNKTKYYIFDVYLNHYIQYVYLLFAINIYKNAESFFILNATDRKLVYLTDKIKEMVDSKSITIEDEGNLEKVHTAITSLINDHNNVSEYNQLIKKGGMCGGSGGVTTMADGVIDDVIKKHNHFFEVFRNTRNKMADYFMEVNNLVNEQIQKLKDFKSSIAQLRPDDYAQFTDINKILQEFRNSEDLNTDYDIKKHPVVLKNIMERLKVDTTKDIDDALKKAVISANITENEISNASSSTQTTNSQLKSNSTNTVNTKLPNASNMPIASNMPNASNPPSTTATTATTKTGGFVRSGTKFPSNNYKILDRHVRACRNKK